MKIFILKGNNTEKKLSKQEELLTLLDKEFNNPFIKAYNYNSTDVSCSANVFDMIDDYKMQEKDQDFDFYVVNVTYPPKKMTFEEMLINKYKINKESIRVIEDTEKISNDVITCTSVEHRACIII